MEKEKKNIVSLDERINKVRELSSRYWQSSFWYEDCAPSKKEDCIALQLSKEEVSAISVLVPKVFNKDLTINKFFLVSTVTQDNKFVFGIEKGLGSLDGKSYRFEYLFVQDGEYGDIVMSCRNGSERGIDHEIYPILHISSMPEETQELMSTMLDIAEDRLV